MNTTTRLRLTDGTILYESEPKQHLLHTAPEPYVLFGGAAGGGKSLGLRLHGILACLANDGCRALLLRRHTVELESTHVLARTLPLAAMPPEIGAWKSQAKRFEFPNGSMLMLGHCENDSDFSTHLSTEWDLILVDEGSQFTEWQLVMLGSRLRTTPGRRTQMVIASNPGGPAHQHLKTFYIERTGPTDGTPYDPDQYRFIPAKVSDNPHIDPEYVEKLKRLPPAERAMYLDGTWDIPAGALFEELRVGEHQVPDRARLAGLRRKVTADWGRSNIAPAVWWESGADTPNLPAEHHAYQEWGPANITPPAWAAGVLEMSGYANGQWTDPERAIVEVELDAAAFDNQQNHMPSPAEQMIPTFRAAGVRLVPSTKGPESVKHGCDLLHTYFETYDGRFRPLITIAASCKHLWAALVTIQRGDADKGEAGVPKNGQHPHVDWLDCCRYFVLGRPKPNPLTTAQRFALDQPMASLAADPLSQLRLYRERAQSAVKAGKPVPPMSAPPKTPRRRQAWER